jgi:hypothetical protein
MGPRFCKIERQRDRHAEQAAGKDDDTHSKHDECSVFVFWEKRDRRRFKPVSTPWRAGC